MLQATDQPLKGSPVALKTEKVFKVGPCRPGHRRSQRSREETDFFAGEGSSTSRRAAGERQALRWGGVPGRSAAGGNHFRGCRGVGWEGTHAGKTLTRFSAVFGSVRLAGARAARLANVKPLGGVAFPVA